MSVRPEPSRLQSLKEAIQMEMREDGDRMARHEQLLEKMNLCILGEVSPPSIAEFMHWRSDLRQALSFKRLYGNVFPLAGQIQSLAQSQPAGESRAS
jgi:hypothetical protein